MGHDSGLEGSQTMAWGRSRRLGGVTANLGLLKAWGILSEASTEGSQDCWDPGARGTTTVKTEAFSVLEGSGMISDFRTSPTDYVWSLDPEGRETPCQ